MNETCILIKLFSIIPARTSAKEVARTADNLHQEIDQYCADTNRALTRPSVVWYGLLPAIVQKAASPGVCRSSNSIIHLCWSLTVYFTIHNVSAEPYAACESVSVRFECGLKFRKNKKKNGRQKNERWFYSRHTRTNVQILIILHIGKSQCPAASEAAVSLRVRSHRVDICVLC